MAARLRLNNPAAWTELTAAAGTRAQAAAASAFPPDFLASGVTIADERHYSGNVSARAVGASTLDLSVSGGAGDAYVLAVRHESGALTFHQGSQSIAAQTAANGARKRGVANVETRFQVTLRSGVRAQGVGHAIIAILLKVADVVVGAVLPALVKHWEEGKWRKHGWLEQFVRFDEAGLQAKRLTPATPHAASTPSGRSLLLLPGTFSEGMSSFQALRNTDFFTRAHALYGNEIYAYDHYSVSKSTEQNAKDLLAALPDDAPIFDVITYSRGGLVLRELVERAAALGPHAQRFRFRRVALVASPNEGTPLATPARWQQTVGWIATLLEHFPDTPWTLAASFVADAIKWIAAKAIESAPGLESMDGGGRGIADLQAAPSPPPDAYSALIANFEPDKGLLQKLLDCGVDAFFGSNNDLVVPTDGGWRVDAGLPQILIPPDRIACFGPGGNVATVPGGATHLNFFGRQETATFLLNALSDAPHALAPYRSEQHASAQSFKSRRGRSQSVQRDQGKERERVTGGNGSSHDEDATASRVFSDTFGLTVLETSGGEALLYATYAGARVIEPFRTHAGDAGQRWKRIIAHDRDIRAYINGDADASPPSDDMLRNYGSVLFETLFPGDVKRLYDIARSREDSTAKSDLGGCHLNVIFTSVVPWVADIPWEFAFDATRRTYLATEEVRFIRNAMTSVPAETLRGNRTVLRILVVSAQPIGAGKLSIAEECAVIRRGFAHLEAAGLAEITIVADATPTDLHRHLVGGDYDVLHFIGHGQYDEDEKTGYLIFEGVNKEIVRMGARELREITRGRGLQMVFLNACESGITGPAEFNRGIAPELVDTGIHCVVANQYSVLDVSATEFAQVFYWMLAQGATIGAAAREARIALNRVIDGENIDWAVPVVYARNPESRFTALRHTSSDMTAASSKKRTRRGRAAGNVVGVCDLNHVFPRIEQTLTRLNGVQSAFEFTLLDVSTPLGVVRTSPAGDRQFYADIATKRLEQLPQELGVDILYAITKYPIMHGPPEAPDWDFYNWWPDSDEAPILIASSWVHGLQSTGREADRAVANFLVQGLAGYLADQEAHHHGAQDCPLFYNEHPDVSSITNEQRFDRFCEAKLKRKLGSDFAALEAILRAFDDPPQQEATSPPARKRSVKRAGKAKSKRGRTKKAA